MLLLFSLPCWNNHAINCIKGLSGVLKGQRKRQKDLGSRSLTTTNCVTLSKPFNLSWPSP